MAGRTTRAFPTLSGAIVGVIRALVPMRLNFVMLLQNTPALRLFE